MKSAIGANLYPLAIVLLLNSVLGAYYYLRIVKLMYFDDPVDTAPLEARSDTRALLSINGLALLLLGIFPQWLLGMCVVALTRSY